MVEHSLCQMSSLMMHENYDGSLTFSRQRNVIASSPVESKGEPRSMPMDPSANSVAKVARMELYETVCFELSSKTKFEVGGVDPH